VVALNHAVAVSRAQGALAALPLLEPLAEPLANYPWLHSVRADLLHALHHHKEAAAALRQALALTQNQAEQRLLKTRLADVELALARSS
jgi:RNA polymerase sigma-70 factor (ECF subfamily)